MLTGTAFDHGYVLLGTRREQVRLAGNAVTPPAATCLVAAMVEALEGHVDLGVEQLPMAA